MLVVGKREMVRAGEIRTPAFRVELDFAGLRTTSWVTDTGEVVREDASALTEGVALRFVRIAEADRERIRRFVAHKMTKTKPRRTMSAV